MLHLTHAPNTCEDKTTKTSILLAHNIIIVNVSKHFVSNYKLQEQASFYLDELASIAMYMDGKLEIL